MKVEKSPSIYSRGLLVFTDYPSVEVDFWVAHSPYPDGKWRGEEKCITNPDGCPILFKDMESAESYIKEHGFQNYFKPVKIKVILPKIYSSI